MKGPQVFFVVILVLAALWVGSKIELFGGGGNVTQSSSASEGLPLGSSVTVQIRRNVLTGASPLMVSPMTSVHNGVTVCVNGTLEGVSKDWIVVQSDGRDHWIARDTVLMVTVNG